MEFSRQEYWSEVPFPPPEDLPDPGIEPMSLLPPALAGGFFITNATWEAPKVKQNHKTFIKKKIRENLQGPGQGKEFLDLKPKA